jgi:hypothetical protein
MSSLDTEIKQLKKKVKPSGTCYRVLWPGASEVACSLKEGELVPLTDCDLCQLERHDLAVQWLPGRSP